MYGADIISLIEKIDVIKDHFVGLYNWSHLPKVITLMTNIYIGFCSFCAYFVQLCKNGCRLSSRTRYCIVHGTEEDRVESLQ